MDRPRIGDPHEVRRNQGRCAQCSPTYVGVLDGEPLVLVAMGSDLSRHRRCELQVRVEGPRVPALHLSQDPLRLHDLVAQSDRVSRLNRPQNPAFGFFVPSLVLVLLSGALWA